MQVKIKKLHPFAITPTYATDGSGCFDIYTIDNALSVAGIGPGDAFAFRTGLVFEVPEDHVMLVFSRSGHGFKNDIRLANCVGVIDSDYRGELLVKLRCDEEAPIMAFGKAPAEKTYLRINPGDRIAQALVVPIPRIQFVEVDELGTTARGAGGFGSTGK